MSTLSSAIHDPRPDAGSSEPRATRRGMLAWCLATGGLLGGSGALRVLGQGPAGPGETAVDSPFPLNNIPKQLDGWAFREGSETILDPITTRTTGSTDHIIRTYYDQITGSAVSVLVLSGPAEPVLPHSPQVCYPANGYRPVGEPADRTIRVDDGLSAVFRAANFAKSGGRIVLRQLVYHSYRLDGVWSPAVSDRNLPRRRAGLFKVQVNRLMLNGERTEGDEPIESFLQHLLPRIEQLVAAATATPAGSTAAR